MPREVDQEVVLTNGWHVVRHKDDTWSLVCPNCLIWFPITDKQFEGRESIWHECGFLEQTALNTKLGPERF